MQVMSLDTACPLTVSPSYACAWVCDSHFHVFNARESVAGSRYVPDYAASLADWESQSSPLDVTRGVVVQPSFLGADNRLLLATLAQHPHRLRGVAVVSESATETELRSLHARGVSGVRLNLTGATDDVRVIRELPATWWSALIAVGLHLELHSDIGRIGALLPLVPNDVTVVLDHFGKPSEASLADETVRAVSARQNMGWETYITLSGAYRQRATDRQSQQNRSVELAALWLEVVGRDHLLWGSDWPCTNYETEAHFTVLRTTLNDWLPNDSDQQAALCHNPHRLYWR